MVAGVGVALAAAVAFGWSAALMHRSTFSAPESVRGTRALLRHLVVQRTWLAGMTASLTGFALHALALHLASLALVQPLVVTGLVFSFAFRAVLDRRLPSRGLMTWVSVTAAGLALFVVAAGSTRSSTSLDGTAAALMLGTGAVFAATGVLAARNTPPHRAGLLLGIAAGVIFGLIAGTTKAATTAASQGALLTSWPLYTLCALGVTGFLVNQRAYHSAPLSASLPALNMANPLVAVAFGIAVFHERPSAQFTAIAAEVVGLSGVLAGIFFLARHEGIATAA
jgi:drug/metabolite transporter (DMT)-like permease